MFIAWFAILAPSALLAQTDNIWRGTTSTNWSTASNWSLNLVPTTTHNIRIPRATNLPTLTAAGVARTITFVDSLTDSPTATLTVGSQTLTVGTAGAAGLITINDSGVLNISTGTVTLSNAGSMTINSGGSVSLTSTGTIVVNGSWVNNGGSISNTSGTVSFTGTGQTIGGTASTAFPAIAIGAGATYTMNNNNTATALTFSAGGTASSLTHGGTSDLTVNGNVTVNQPTANTVTTSWNINAGSATVTGTTTVGGTNSTASRVARIAVTAGSVIFGGTTTLSTGTSSASALITVSTGIVTFNSAFSHTEGTISFTGAGTINFNSSYSFGPTASAAPILTTVAGANLNFAGNITTAVALTLNATSNSAVTGVLNATPTANLVFGHLTIAGGDTLNTVSAAGALTVAGNLTLNGTGALNGSEAVLLTGANAIIDGTGSIGAATTVSQPHIIAATADLTITGAMTLSSASGDISNNGRVTASSINGTVAGATWTNLANSFLNISGTMLTTGTLTATAVPNTVNYNGSGAQTIKGTTYSNLNVSNTGATATFGASTTVNNDFTISSGTAAIGAFTLTVSGTTSFTGTFNITSTTGTKTFNNLIVNSGGVFNNNTVNEAVTINGNVQNDGTMNAGTGVYTLAGVSKIISGGSATTIASISATGSYTNTANLTVSTALTGAGSFTNDTDARLSISATAANFTVTTFTASAAGNVVDYNALAAQTIRVPTGSTYYHLTGSGFGAKTVGGDLTVDGDLTITDFASFNAGTSRSHTFRGNWNVTTATSPPFAFTTSSTINFETPATPAVTSLSGTLAATIAFDSVNINNTAGFNSSLNLSASGNFTVGSGATFTPAEAVVVIGTGTLTGSGVVKVTRTTITADFLTQYPITNKTLTNLTVDYEASGAQSVNALNYFNLIVRGTRGSNNITFSAGTVGVSGTFSPLATFSTGAYVVTGNTINYNGTGAQVIRVFNYNDLVSSSTGSRTLESSGTTKVAGNFTPGTNSYTITGSTIDYNGSAQNVAVFNYNNLALSTSGTKTFGSGTTRIAGTFTLGGTATADAVTNSSTIEYNGTTTQVTPAIAYSGLTLNNASGIQIAGDITVSGTLTFTTGTITTNANKVSVTSTGSVTRTSGHVVGNLEKQIPSGTPSPTFEVGSATAYTPLTLSFASVTTPGSLTVRTVSTDHAEILTSGIEASKSVNRHWVMTGSGLVFTTFDATLNFVAGDVDAGANTAAFIVARRSGGLWSLPTVGTRTPTSTQATGVTGFGDFQIGEAAAAAAKLWDGDAGTSNWGDPNNWNPDGVPLASNNVSLTGTDTITINVAAVCNSITLNNSGLVVTIQGGNSLNASGDFSLVNGRLNTQASFPSVTGTLNITGGTVGYTGSGSQTVQALNYSHLTLSGGGAKTFASGTTRITGDFTVSGVTADATANSTTIEFNGSGAQTVGAINYHNLTFSNAGIKTFASGTTGIAGAYTITGAASANATTNTTTIGYNGVGIQNIALIDYHHLTLSNSGTKTFGVGTTRIAGNFTVSGVTADATTNSTTIEFNGSGAQTVGAINYHNLTFSNAAVKTFATGSAGIANSFTLSGSATANATTNGSTIVYNGSGAQNVTQIDYHHLTLSNNGTKTFGVGITKIAGNFAISGLTNANTTTNSAIIEFNGTSLQSTPSSAYVGLMINNASGVVLTGDATVSGTLTFTTGNISTGANKISVNSTGTVSRTDGHVVGNFEKNVPTNFGGVTRTFEVGDATAYTPVTVAFASVIAGGNLTVSTTTGDHPQILTSGIDDAKSVNRYWTLTNNGIIFDNYSATLNFVAGDIDPAANTANFNISRYSGGSWNTATVGTRTSTSTQATGLTGFGEFQVGEVGAAATTWDGGAGTNNWGDAANWSPNGIPTSTTNVSFSGAFTININVAANCNSITLNHASLSVTIMSGNSLTVAGNFNLVNGTFNTQNAFPSVTGTTTISGGTVGYTGSGAQTIQGLTYNNLTVTGSPDTSTHKGAVGDVSINGTLTVAVNNTLDMRNFSFLTLGSGSNSGKIMWQGSSSHALSGAGTTEFYGSTASTVAAGTYGNMLFTGSGTMTISGAVLATGGNAAFGVTVSNNLTISGTGSLTVTGMDLNNDGTITNSGSITVN